MARYALKRLIIMPFMLLAIAFLVFMMLHFAAGDPVVMMLPTEWTQEDYDEMAARFGLDQPIMVQFFNWVVNAAQGDFGLSWRTRTPVMDDFGFRIPTSLWLAFLTMVVLILVGIPLGVICAVKQYTIFDTVINFVAKFMGSIPGFWLGIMLIIVFSVNLGWLPTFGTGTWRHWVLPVVTLLLPFLAMYIRNVRSAMLDCIRQDYVRTARSKGASETIVIYRDALKNALLPIITLSGGMFTALIGGAVIVERVFAIPGVGSMIVDAVNFRDTPALVAATMILSVMTIVIMLIVDLSYALVDPRVKSTLAGKKKQKKQTEKTEGVS